MQRQRTRQLIPLTVKFHAARRISKLLQFLLEELVAETKTFGIRQQIRDWVPLEARPYTRLRHNVSAPSRASYFRHSRSDSINFLLRLNRTRSSRGFWFLREAVGVYASGSEIVSKTIDGEQGIPNFGKNCTVWNSLNECPRVFLRNQSIDLSSLNCLIRAIAE